MEKPDSKIVEHIHSLLEDKREMEAAIKKLQEQANLLVSEISKEPNKLELATYLYWFFPEIRAKELAQATIGENNIHKFLETIGSIKANIHCDICNSKILIKSRSQLSEQSKRANSETASWAEGYKVLCEDCQTKVMVQRHQNYRETEKARTEHLEQLKNMPYKDYLKTTEWKERRIKHLKSAGYRCQVCNSPQQPLDVHHRTYERRGQEYYKDLIVLCRDCHSKFHEYGKLMNH